MFIVYLLLFAALWLLASLVVAALAVAALGFGLARRRWGVALGAALALAITGPSAWTALSFSQAYGVVGWSSRPDLPGEYAGATLTLTLGDDGRYVLSSPDGQERGRWRAEPAEGEGVTAVAWTLTLAPEAGAPERAASVRWDLVMGLDGDQLAPSWWCGAVCR